MRITRIQISNFGKLHEVDFDFDEGLTVFCRENGWGKSTLAAFVKAMFYGLESTTKRSVAENERKHFLPWQGGLYGGSMEFLVGDKLYRVERTFGKTESEDTFDFYEGKSGQKSTDYSFKLGEELFQVDRKAFENTIFFPRNYTGIKATDSLNSKLTHVENESNDMGNYEQAVKLLEVKKKGLRNAHGGGDLSRWEVQKKKAESELADAGRKAEECQKISDHLKEIEKTRSQAKKEIDAIEKNLAKAQTAETRNAQRQMLNNLKEKADADEESFRRETRKMQQTRQLLSDEELKKCQSQFWTLQEIKNKEMPPEEQSDNPSDKQRLAGRNFLVLLAVIFAVVATACLSQKAFFSGVIFAVFSVLMIVFAVRLTAKKRRQKRQTQLRQEEKGRQKKREQQEQQLRRDISQALNIPSGFTEKEFSDACERVRCQNAELDRTKENFKRLQKDAQNSQAEYQKYCQQFSGQELSAILCEDETTQDVSGLQKEKIAWQKRSEELLQESEEGKARLAVLQEQMEQIPELEEEKARLDELLTEGEKEAELLDKTLKYLEKAKEEFSHRYLGTIEEKMGEYLHILCPEEKEEPKVNVSLAVALNRHGKSNDLAYYSTGWQQIVYFAQRLSIVDAFFEKEQPVLFLDDTFADFDDKKQKEAMALIKRLSKNWQIVYFTCHTAMRTGD